MKKKQLRNRKLSYFALALDVKVCKIGMSVKFLSRHQAVAQTERGTSLRQVRTQVRDLLKFDISILDEWGMCVVRRRKLTAIIPCRSRQL
ncbi:MAG TPA: hypothetical protein DCM41_01030 [Synergistaceae bacterium]|nr:hypothetical protein [Synergistaceae bacterium]